MHAWAFPLVSRNLSSQMCSSPFVAWANTPCKKHHVTKKEECIKKISWAQKIHNRDTNPVNQLL
jgi:hypothetical protein